jgi:hypothetical protein
MLLRIVSMGALLMAGCVFAPPAVSQTQKQTQTLGGRAPGAAPGPGPRRTRSISVEPAQTKKRSGSRAECAALARAQKLRGRKRTAFIRECTGKQ